ncbi:MAG: hypothetical protein UT55_C0081G0003 [Candidatus Peregrinibacteria bacterium GW2011_GWE2_39_6]|nr:MAG: hypothetical protein UT36_C0001G0045 [Candidatus Peregrinibacteria bacterium GW2011_GWF2_39_17]KKR23850.1 MAG: hypothetical protein UT55_C0081G0003 [Candidatus Peregrinibacteria bacterium GW2011_GWE2_39_6]HCW32387.1 hypothetical protein [Candidatus Peregrinibacteria bacterium]
MTAESPNSLNSLEGVEESAVKKSAKVCPDCSETLKATTDCLAGALKGLQTAPFSETGGRGVTTESEDMLEKGLKARAQCAKGLIEATLKGIEV